jgi:hypothetical protein
LDIIQKKNVRGFVVGATNILFKQKTNLTDVVISVENSTPSNGETLESPFTGDSYDSQSNDLSPPSCIDLEWHDNDLKRLVTLTTADLRFADLVVRQVEAVNDDSVWEGGDEWIRSQMKGKRH